MNVTIQTTSDDVDLIEDLMEGSPFKRDMLLSIALRIGLKAIKQDPTILLPYVSKAGSCGKSGSWLRRRASSKLPPNSNLKSLPNCATGSGRSFPVSISAIILNSSSSSSYRIGEWSNGRCSFSGINSG